MRLYSGIRKTAGYYATKSTPCANLYHKAGEAVKPLKDCRIGFSGLSGWPEGSVLNCRLRAQNELWPLPAGKVKSSPRCVQFVEIYSRGAHGSLGSGSNGGKGGFSQRYGLGLFLRTIHLASSTAQKTVEARAKLINNSHQLRDVVLKIP